jgi:hypothetical protein
MPILPATGTEITMGRVHKSKTNVTASTGSNLALSGTMAAHIGQSSGTQISLSSAFGGRTFPYTY